MNLKQCGISVGTDGEWGPSNHVTRGRMAGGCSLDCGWLRSICQWDPCEMGGTAGTAMPRGGTREGERTKEDLVAADDSFGCAS